MFYCSFLDLGHLFLPVVPRVKVYFALWIFPTRSPVRSYRRTCCLKNQLRVGKNELSVEKELLPEEPIEVFLSESMGLEVAEINSTSAVGHADCPPVFRKAFMLVEVAREIRSSREICPAQSNCLRNTLSTIGLCLKSVEADSRTQSLVGVLVWEMERAMELLRACNQQDWMRRTILYHDNYAEFKDVQTDLCECLRLLSEQSEHPWGIIGGDPELHPNLLAAPGGSIPIPSRETLRSAAAEDRRHLLQMVDLSEASSKRLQNRVRLLLTRRNPVKGLRLLREVLYETDPRSEYDPNSELPKHLLIDHKQLKLGKRIGHGSYSSVYDALWLDHQFAVKIFRQGDRTFKRELAALMSVKHPNIVRIAGYLHQPNSYSLVMERMRMDLEKLINIRNEAGNHAPFPMHVSLRILLQIAKAMKLLHAQSIIHRDLKPSNVLVNFGNGNDDEHLKVKIADFGLARTKFATYRTNATARVGSKVFRAPEVYQNENYSRKADVYSFAMVCYTVLTGRLPYTDIVQKPDFILLVRDKGVRPKLSDSCCPKDLACFVTSCWSEKPEERPAFSSICDSLKLFLLQGY